MAFDVSSRNVKLDSDNNLQAECMNLRKEWEDAAIPLKDFVSNDDGTLAWGGRSFKDSARNVGLRESRFLEGELRDMRGVWKFASLDLSLYIRNFDGALRAFDDQPEYLADKSWHGANCYIINEVLGSCLDLDNGQSSSQPSMLLAQISQANQLMAPRHKDGPSFPVIKIKYGAWNR